MRKGLKAQKNGQARMDIVCEARRSTEGLWSMERLRGHLVTKAIRNTLVRIEPNSLRKKFSGSPLQARGPE